MPNPTGLKATYRWAPVWSSRSVAIGLTSSGARAAKAPPHCRLKRSKPPRNTDTWFCWTDTRCGNGNRLGWHVGETHSVAYFFKEGGGGGFHCEMRIYPTLGIATVVLATASLGCPAPTGSWVRNSWPNRCPMATRCWWRRRRPMRSTRASTSSCVIVVRHRGAGPHTARRGQPLECRTARSGERPGFPGSHGRVRHWPARWPPTSLRARASRPTH